MIRFFKIKFVIFITIAFMLSGCGIYSFTGASYGTAKTVSVGFFQNLAPVVVPTLSNTLTEALKDRFIQQTPMEMVKNDADLQFEGEIRDYSVTSTAISAEEVATKNRLTITIHVKFVNVTEEKWNFDKNFSEYEDFPSTQSLSSVQSELIETIVKKLVEDIFNASVANW